LIAGSCSASWSADMRALLVAMLAALLMCVSAGGA
jgi:hypothetical protein